MTDDRTGGSVYSRWRYSDWIIPAFILGMLAGFYVATVGGSPRPDPMARRYADAWSLDEMTGQLFKNAIDAQATMPELAKAYGRAATATFQLQVQLQKEDAKNEYEMPVAERLDLPR